jgi:hypothetical protein
VVWSRRPSRDGALAPGMQPWLVLLHRSDVTGLLLDCQPVAGRSALAVSASRSGFQALPRAGGQVSAVRT